MVPLLEIIPYLEAVRSAVKPGHQVYLVGGAVRDLQMSVPVHDLDFAISDETIRVARQMARRFDGKFFVLDDERQSGRVILTRQDQPPLLIDFTQLADDDLDTDLKKRDFTINAMAIDPHDPGRLIDPCHGLEDLQNKVLRNCTPTSLADDPVRTLRGIRFAVQLSLKLSEDTEQQTRIAFVHLNRSSPERIRDELFKILSNPRPDLALRLMEQLGGLTVLFPEMAGLKGVTQPAPHGLDVWEHSIVTVQQLAWLIDLLGAPPDPDPFLSDLSNSTLKVFERFKLQLQKHLAERLASDRSTRALLMLGALYHDMGKPAARTLGEAGRIRFFGHEQVGADIIEQRGKALVLSKDEIERLQLIVQHHMRPHQLAQTVEKQSGRLLHLRTIFHFFRDTGLAGVDICLLSLADTLATYQARLPDKYWKAELEVVNELFEAWWEKPEQSVRPPAVVDGHDLIVVLGMKPGPKVGELLALIREAQATGQVKTREEALAYARDWLEKPGGVT